MSTPRNPRLSWALWLAARGWPVFPLLPGRKQPLIQDWEQAATTDSDPITRHWSAHPEHNIGLATGPAGLLVVDLDVARPDKPTHQDWISGGVVHGAQTLRRLTEQPGATMPDTFTVRTPSGGTHLYHRQPAGPHAPRLRSTRGTDRGGLGPLVDTRGWGGYVVAPGSTAPQGHYELVANLAVADLPGWLVHRLSVHPPTAVSAPRRIAVDKLSAYLQAALDREAEHIRTAKPGTHNRAQYTAAAAIGGLVGGGYLDHATAHQLLIQSALGHITGTCHCTERGVSAAIESGLRYGARRPRRIDPEGTAA
jgi:hypothetical protein